MDSWQDWMKPELVWFIAGLAMLLLEFIIPGLIIFFFGVGAFVVALLCIFFDIPINYQLLIFLGSSVLLLVILRRELSNTFMGHVGFTMDTAENLDDFTGGQCFPALRNNNQSIFARHRDESAFEFSRCYDQLMLIGFEAGVNKLGPVFMAANRLGQLGPDNRKRKGCFPSHFHDRR